MYNVIEYSSFDVYRSLTKLLKKQEMFQTKRRFTLYKFWAVRDSQTNYETLDVDTNVVLISKSSNNRYVWEE